MSSNLLLNIHVENAKMVGFWDETYKSSVIKAVEMNYNAEVLTHWGISDLVMNGDKVLIKWYKRHSPLTPEQLTEKYGR